MRIHELKTIQPYFDHVWAGKKAFEVRKFDRPFRCGDLLLLKEYDAGLEMYSGREILVEVTYFLDDTNYVKDGYVIMGFNVLKRYEFCLV